MNGKLLIETWDGGSGRLDRYTIAISGIQVSNNRVYTMVFGSSDNPFHPQGFGQFSHEELTADFRRKSHRHFGKRINYTELPKDVQRYIRQLLIIE